MPPDPILPPTDTLKPNAPWDSRTAGDMPRSWVSPWVQFSRRPVIVTLNLRGRFVNSLFFRKMLVYSAPTGAASKSSSAVKP